MRRMFSEKQLGIVALEQLTDKDLKVKTLEQSEFNYSIPFELNASQSLTINNIYNRFAVIDNVLFVIVNFILTNSTGETKTLGSGYGHVGNLQFEIDSEIANKLVDINGVKVSEVATNDTLISSSPCQILTSKVLDATSVFYNGRLSLVNRSSANKLSVQVALNGGSSNRITIADGASLYITARMALTLL